MAIAVAFTGLAKAIAATCQPRREPHRHRPHLWLLPGSSIGAALTFPLCGQLIHMWGWESVFYVCGGLGVVWYAFWVVLVFDTPSQHPRISPLELTYITESLGKSVSQKKVSCGVGCRPG